MFLSSRVRFSVLSVFIFFAAFSAVLIFLPVIKADIAPAKLIHAKPVKYLDSTFTNPKYLSGQSASIFQDDKISGQVMADTEGGESASIVILLNDQADVSSAYTIKDQDERGWFVYNTLTKHANLTQFNLRLFLKDRGVKYQSYWAANMIVAEVERPLVLQIAKRDDVARIDSNRPSRWIEDPELANRKVSPNLPLSPDTVEWGVANVNAPAVWAKGFDGTGIVVGGLDTGIRWSHDAVRPQYRGWNGATADHNYNWHDAIHTGGGICGADTPVPCDDSGHGSHTLGTMVGDDGNGNQVGVAPGAQWIGCRNMDRGNGTPATYTECFQFMMAPTDMAGNNADPARRPHIVNNSWGCPSSEGCTTRAELELIVDNTQAAGIFVAVSAGNTGPGCSSVTTPAAIYSSSFSVGAYNVSNNMANFSSRGPSTFYDPNLLKPNISAPGVNVRSITNSGDTAYANLQGTSMAAPHAAGVVALLWSARSELVREIKATKILLQNTANPDVTVTPQTCGGIPSTQVPNNSFGYGRIDALAAVTAATPAISVSGQILSPSGLSLSKAVVTLTDSNNFRRTAMTSSFGIYFFENVPADEIYTISVSSKRFRFASRFVTPTANLANVDFVGLE